MESLDPRVARLPKIGNNESFQSIPSLDQLTTFEVFVQPKPDKPFQHEGCVHASDIELAFVLGKEAFTRRFTCVSLNVVETQKIFVSPYSEGEQSAYDLIKGESHQTNPNTDFEIYHLLKRGKQHIYIGSVEGRDEIDAFQKARVKFKSDKPVYNIWCIQKRDIRFTKPEEIDLWTTLPEKRFRDAADYKGGDKLKNFLERTSVKHS